MAHRLSPFLLLLAALTAPLQADVKEERIEYAGARFRVFRLAPEQLQLVWKAPDGQPFRSFDRVQADFARHGKSIRFIMNAGIFEPGGIPSGLHIQDGKPLLPLNEKDAPGNFFLKPNGIVACTDGKALITTVPEWKSRQRQAVFAAQSGPMLLIHGKRHPAFTDGSTSRLHRNGVGVDREGRLVFAITDRQQMVNLWDFAGLFLKLGCQNALFLDGDISQVAVNPQAPVESNLFGAMFVVTE